MFETQNRDAQPVDHNWYLINLAIPAALFSSPYAIDWLSNKVYNHMNPLGPEIYVPVVPDLPVTEEPVVVIPEVEEPVVEPVTGGDTQKDKYSLDMPKSSYQDIIFEGIIMYI